MSTEPFLRDVEPGEAAASRRIRPEPTQAHENRPWFQSSLLWSRFWSRPWSWCASVQLRPWTYLEPGEQTAFLAAMPADERRYYAFALGTGVRHGNPGKPTKTGKTRRVPLFGMAVEAARAQVAFLKGKTNPKRVFWPTLTGNHRAEGSPEGWADWLKAAGIKRPVRVYDLRHTCASSLVAGWWGRRWSIEEVKEVLGHSDIKMTQRYVHLGDTALRAATRETNAAYFGPRPVQNEAQIVDIAGDLAAFVNRRSRVQVSELAPLSPRTL